MEIFVLHILKLNIIAAVIILLVKLLAILFKGQVSARWKYIIWLLITVSLCIPVRLPANFTLVDFKTKQPWLNVDFEAFNRMNKIRRQRITQQDRERDSRKWK